MQKGRPKAPLFLIQLPARFPAIAATSTMPAAATAASGPAATTTAAAESAAAATTTAAESAVGLGTGFIDVQCASVEGVSIEGGNGLIRLAFIFHFDECETARPSGFAIRHNPGAIHLAVPFEEATNTLFTGIEVQVAYENILHSVLLSI